jgi:hypothetical protein
MSFKPLFWSHTPYSEDGMIRRIETLDVARRGRPRIISDHACLAMTLMWTRTTCQEFILGSYFGLVGSSVSVWL